MLSAALALAMTLTTHPWCNVHAPDASGTELQDRYVFAANGKDLDVQIYLWNGKQRGSLLASAKGSYQAVGSTLRLTVNGQVINGTYRIDQRDPQTGKDRLFILSGGQEIAYDPCL